MKTIRKIMKAKVCAQVIMLAAIFSMVACSTRSLDRNHAMGSDVSLVEPDSTLDFPDGSKEDVEQTLALDSQNEAEFSAVAKKAQEIKAELKSNRQSILREKAEEKATALAETIYTTYMQPLEHIALNPKYSGDQVLNQYRIVQTVYQRYAERLALMQQLSPAAVGKRNLLAKFYKMATAQCGPELHSCRIGTVRMVGTSSQAAYILNEYAWALDRAIFALEQGFKDKKITLEDYRTQRLAMIRTKRNATKFGIKLHNQSESVISRLYLLYLLGKRQFEELNDSQTSPLDKGQYKYDIQRISVLLKSSLNDPEFRNELGPSITRIWSSFSARQAKEQREEYGTVQAATNVMKIACEFFYDSDGMMKAAKDSLLDKDASGAIGFLREVEDLRKSPNSIIFANMRLNLNISEANLMPLFIIDQIYRGHWENDVTESCWKARQKSMDMTARKKDNDNFMELTKLYLRVELIKQIIKTNNYMSNVFQPKEDEIRAKSGDMFIKAIVDSHGLKDSWEELITNINKVYGFINWTMGASRVDEQTKEFKELTYLILGIRNNIKLLATYPNMLVLCYYMAAKHFGATFTTWWGDQFTLGAETVINWIFAEIKEDVARPFFDFGNDFRRIYSFDNLYSLFYALKTNTFGTFEAVDLAAMKSTGNTWDLPINDINFFSQVIQSYINSEKKDTEGALKLIEPIFNNSDYYNNLKEICEIERKIQNNNPVPRSYKTVQYDLPTITERTFIGYSDKQPGSVFERVYGTDMQKVLRTSQQDFYRKYLFIGTMIDILEDHWKSILKAAPTEPTANLWKTSIDPFGKLEENLDLSLEAMNKLTDIRSEFHGMFDFTRRAHQLFMAKHRELGDCLSVVDKTEDEQEMKLYAKEVEYLKAVFRATRKMNSEVKEALEPRAEELAANAAALNAELKSRVDSFDGPQPGVAAEGMQAVKDSIIEKYSNLGEAIKQKYKDIQEAIEKKYTDAANAKIDADANYEQKELAALSRAYFDKVDDLSPSDKLSVDGGYTYTQWNMALRMRHNLMDINSNIRIDKPSSLDSVDIYTSRTNANQVQVRITPDMSDDDFVKAVLSNAQARKYLTWIRSTSYYGSSDGTAHNLSRYVSRLSTIMTAYTAQELGIFRESNNDCLTVAQDDKQLGRHRSCDTVTDKYAPISAKEIAQEVMNIVNLVHITPSEEKLLRMLNINGKYNSGEISGFFLDTRNEPHPIFDGPYRTISETLILFNQAKDAAVALNALTSTGNEARTAALAGEISSVDGSSSAPEVDWVNQPSKELIFLADQDPVRKLTRSRYRPYVLATLKMESDFRDVILCYEDLARQKNQGRRDKYLYELDLQSPKERVGKWIDPFKSDASSALYVDRELTKNFDSVVTQFQKDTWKVYEVKKGDKDFGKVTPEVSREQRCQELLR